MTVLVKTNTVAKKATGVAIVPVIRPRTVKKPRKRFTPGLFTPYITMFFLSAMVIIVVSFACTMMVIRDLLFNNDLRYRGTCAISSTDDMDYLVLNDSPSQMWWYGVPLVQMKVYSSPSDLISSRIMNQLLEDMSIADRREEISVHDGTRAYDIIHDFDDNLTSIISDDRCYVMDIILDFVLEPSRLIEGFHNESQMDLSHAHSTFRAELPAVPDALVPRACRSVAPVYRLSLENSLVLRKRSIVVKTTMAPLPSTATKDVEDKLEAPQTDFVQFSGKHLQRITINNMDDIINYETANSVQHAHPKLNAGNLASKE